MALTACLVAVVFLGRFGVGSIEVALLAIYVLLGVAAACGRLNLSIPRAIRFAVALGAACVSYAVNTRFSHAGLSSPSSLALLVVIYVPFLFVLRERALGEAPVAFALARLGDVAFVFAIAGIVQFYAQFVVHARWLFDFTPSVPSALRGPSGYNTVIRAGRFYKSNGFFGREPSSYSFMMALGLLDEWSRRRRFARVACFGLGLLLSYSGSGILALAAASVFPIRRATFVRVAGLAAAGLVVFWLLGDALDLSLTVGRVFEFKSERSSGYARYVAPFRLVLDTYDTEPWSLWLGHGPGTISHGGAPSFSHGMRTYAFHDPTWAKLIFEYGLLGFAAFILLVWSVVAHPGVPLSVRVVLFFSWLVMGGHLLSPEHVVLMLALAGVLPRAAPARAAPVTGAAAATFGEPLGKALSHV